MQATTGERKRDEERPGPAAWAPAALIAFASLFFAGAAQTAPGDSTTAAGVFPPWWSRAAVIEAAASAGGVVSVGSQPFIVIVRAPSGPAAPRLHEAGALFSIDAGLARLCGA